MLTGGFFHMVVINSLQYLIHTDKNINKIKTTFQNTHTHYDSVHVYHTSSVM